MKFNLSKNVKKILIRKGVGILLKKIIIFLFALSFLAFIAIQLEFPTEDIINFIGGIFIFSFILVLIFDYGKYNNSKNNPDISLEHKKELDKLFENEFLNKDIKISFLEILELFIKDIGKIFNFTISITSKFLLIILIIAIIIGIIIAIINFPIATIIILLILILLSLNR